MDYIIPRSVARDLDNAFENLEFLPETLNRAKGNKVGDRQVQLARKSRGTGRSKQTMQLHEIATEGPHRGRPLPRSSKPTSPSPRRSAVLAPSGTPVA